MTDYFTALEQPRMPWLDPAQLKEAFHRKTLTAHPDVAGPGETQDFAALNEAYQVLQDPRRRIQHLLSLENAAPLSENPAVPDDLQELFMSIGAVTQRASGVLQKAKTISNVLGRSLLQRELIGVNQDLGELREKAGRLLQSALDELRDINAAWEGDRAGQIPGLSRLSHRFAYLGRWMAQLDELAFQLSAL
jgi:curved DNA-binding protein CbpA